MKVILYIGHHKVGSTALQAFMAHNTLPLLRKGILYPAVESQGLSHLLAQALGFESVFDFRPLKNLDEPHNALAFRMLSEKTGNPIPPWHRPLPGLPAMVNTLKHQVEVLQPHTVILCAEVFSNFGAGHIDLIAKLRQLFPNAEYELYCALRRPDEYAVSWFGQLLRFGRKLDALSTPKDPGTQSIHFNYRLMLEPWLQEFDGCRVHIRNYADIRAAGGSVQDFIAEVDCDFPTGLPGGGSANTGFPRSAYEIIRRGNQDLPPAQAGALRNFFMTGAHPVNPALDNEVELIGAEQRTRMVRDFAPIHDFLNARTRRDAFFPDIEEMLDVRPVPSIEAARQVLDRIDPQTLPHPELHDYLRGLHEAL